MMKTTQFLAIAALVLCIHLAQADAIEDQLQAALKAYQAGDYPAAMNELKFAQADLQEKINQSSKTLLPEPLEGWTASETEVQNMGGMMGGGTQLSRRYTRQADSATVELQIIANSPMIQMAAMMLNNPMIMQNDPSMKTFRLGSQRGIMKHAPNSTDWEATLILGSGNIMIQGNGSGLKDDSAVKAYLKKLDQKKVVATFSAT